MPDFERVLQRVLSFKFFNRLYDFFCHLSIVKGGFSLQGILVPLMLIVLGIASAYSVKKVERH